MFHRSFSFARKHRWLVGFLLFVIAINAVAFRHAWLLTHFVNGGSRTWAPDRLSMFGKLGVLVHGVEIPKRLNDPVSASELNPPRTVQFTTRDGVRLEAWDFHGAQSDRVALLFHGYAVSRSVLQDEARFLRDCGFRTVLVDFRGSGGSEGSTTTLGWDEAMDVAAAVAWAKQDSPNARLLLYGQSLGAAAILRAVATEKIEPSAIILECPFDKLITTIGHRYHLMNLPAFPLAHLLVFWGGVQNGFNAFAHNPVDYAQSVRCPTLVLGGEQDNWVRPEEVHRVAKAMGGNAECQIFAGVGHSSYSRRVGEEYRRVVGAWIQTLPF